MTAPAHSSWSRRNPYDVALLDYKMPGMDGLTLYREIKRLRAGTVAIVVTAYAGGTTAEEALAPGRGKWWPSRSISPGCWAWSARPWVNRWSWWSMTTTTCAPISGTCSGSAAFGSAWPTTRPMPVDRLKDANFQAVLIDMKLPAGDGGSVFRLVRQANPQARTIVITGHRGEMDQQVQQLLHEGADAVCYKPFDVPELLSTLNQLTASEAKTDASAGAPR